MTGAAGLAVAGGFTAWLVSSTAGERAADDPFGAGGLEQSMWPQEWPATEEFPYRGSPAADWAEGRDGIRLPLARAVGGLSEAQVADSLRQVKRLLMAANLERVPASEVVAMLDPASPALTALAQNPTALVTRFDPAELSQDRHRVKVQGRITFEAAPSGKGVLIRTDHTFVHPVTSARPGAYEIARDLPEWTRVLTKRQLVLTAGPGAAYPRLQSYRVQLGNAKCSARDGYVHTYFREEGREAGVARDTFNCPVVTSR
ncbi:hypothetical protein ACWCQL_26060 [Streptomyces sp. NPDC002073]